MNNKGTKKQRPNGKVKFRETFAADRVEIMEPGSYTLLTRKQVEGWLDGMNAAKRLADETACREAVAETIEGSLRTAIRRGTGGTHCATKLAAAVLVLSFVSSFLCCSKLRAYEITPGFAFQDGQQLYAAQLEQLVEDATIGVQFYNDQQTTPILGAGYYFLILNPANQTFYRLNAQQALYGNTNIFLNAESEPVPGCGLLLFYDPTNNWIGSTTVSNFLWNSASNINVAGLSFANTNNSAATNAYVLPRWPYPVFSGLNTNYPAHFIVFDTNGVPYRMSLTNTEVAIAFDLGTVMSLPYEYAQEFAPWRLYGTNTVSPFTNAFGWTTNFPIVAYFQPNNGDTLTNATLTDTDTVPVNAYQEGAAGAGVATNTTMTLYSLYEYMTNKNALPPYTIARIQFAGVPDQLLITNMDPVTGIITNISAAVNWSNGPVAVSWAGVTASAQVPTLPQVQSNVLYYAMQTNWPNLAFQLFTNYASALGRTAPITGLGVAPASGKEGTLYWVTNFTSVNCDVIQTVSGASLRTGVYDVYFRSPSVTPFYYLSGTVKVANGTGVPPSVFLNYDDSGSTNFAQIGTGGSGNGYEQFSLVQVLVQPE